ncbi:hypothetical protein Tsubulata_005807 [Turnera subulata]|uniref:RING-type E3 ubiquitin transferase n=1 Tax=Turnera subulata TaxID=218843 RepID=A0A9Q0JQW2_9ROSI|nr:hypothetical protein Tsubulata_005807 [Turnera subulata]
MAHLLLFSFFFFFFLPLLPLLVTSLDTCWWDSCSESETLIRFPFSLHTTNSRCSYPGFSNLLSCNATAHNRTTLTLPRGSGSYYVRFIDYTSQEVVIQDPGNCMARRFLETPLDLYNTPFVPEYFMRTFTFFNCSSNSSSAAAALRGAGRTGRRVSCMSNKNYTVVAVLNDFEGQVVLPQPSSLPSCEVMARSVPVPVPWPRGTESGTRLVWWDPDCRSCEQAGGTCGFKSDDVLETGCFDVPSKEGIPRSAKYGISLGVGIPGLLCIIGVGCYLCGRVKQYRRRPHQPPTTEFAISVQPSIVSSGLDAPTIESYPKTQLGDSGRLPKPNDNTCPICLAEYQPKETLRTIPECSHYFHADCIDAWLRMNATCPLCRNSPEGSLGTPSSSVFSSSSSLVAP